MENKTRWERFKDRAIVFSFVVNAGTILLLVLGGFPAIQAALFVKDDTVEPLLNDLDAAFVGLGESEIDTTINIDEQVAIQFDLPLDQPLPIDFQLPIQQDTVVVLQREVTLNRVYTQFDLGSFGRINGYVTLSLPKDLALPVRLDMTVPVSQTIPVRMNVPVDQTVPIRMAVPVNIKLGEAGLDPAVQDLRAVFAPVSEMVQSLPDGMIGSEE
jgi:hypothetical protein